MSLLRRIFAHGLRPAWELTPGGVIWKLLPTSTGRLIGEARDPDRKTLTLFGVEPSEGITLFRDLTLEEPWWIALEMTIGDLAVLHRFPRPDMPSARGATVVECATGRVLWSDPALRVIRGDSRAALAEREHPLSGSTLELIDPSDGRTIETLGDDLERAHAFQAGRDDTRIWEGWVPSLPLSEEDPGHDEARRQIAREVREAIGAPFIARHGGYMVASVEEPTRTSAEARLANRVDTHLLILRDGRLRYRETIGRAQPISGEEAMFIWNGELIFIRDRRTLVGIPLIEP